MKDPKIDNLEQSKIEEILKINALPPTAKENFYLNFGLELLKNQLNLANELLKQQISICIALLGVSVIYDDLLKDSHILKFVVVLLFFISLICAFLGLIPYHKKKVNYDVPTEIERFTDEALQHKRRYYWISALLIVVGIAIIIGQLFFSFFK